MSYIILFCILLLCFTNIKSLIRLYRSYLFLVKNKYEINKKNNSKITIIIPAMNEVKNVKKSVDYFKKLDDICNVIYVTTSREKDMETYNTLKSEIKKYDNSNLCVINCPNTYGTMATQINYAIKGLSDNDIVAIYNIDSQPERNTFKYVLNNINESIVLQQVSYFDDQLKGVMKGAENWQNRWSLIYEMGKYLSNRKYEFKYCIGHGLFIYKKIFDKIGLFSETEINEDNEFGYRLNINNILIKPIPYMEQADFAKSKKIYIKQQSTWVNGPLYAFKYYNNNAKTINNFILSILNYKAFISWWLFPLFCIILIILTSIYEIVFLPLVLFLILFYITGINFFANRLLIRLGYLKNKYKIDVISDLLFFSLHSFGSYVTLYKIITGENNILNKYNTEK